jgi:hypothetical protein
MLFLNILRTNIINVYDLDMKYIIALQLSKCEKLNINIYY